LVALLQPVDVVDDGDVPRFDASVIAIDRPMAADGCVAEILGFLLVREERDVFTRRALIALEGEDVVGFLVIDLPGDVAPTAASF
jgi:hypothetical protein